VLPRDCTVTNLQNLLISQSWVVIPFCAYQAVEANQLSAFRHEGAKFVYRKNFKTNQLKV
jgi:hypothetical protein